MLQGLGLFLIPYDTIIPHFEALFTKTSFYFDIINGMLEKNKIIVCPLCMSRNSEIYKRSKEFGVPFYKCSRCDLLSIRDLNHGIEIAANPSNKGRCKEYKRRLISVFGDEKKETILEVGPGDYILCAYMEEYCGEYTTIDVGTNFLQNASTSSINYSVPSPSTPEEIFNCSQLIYEKISKEKKKDKFSWGLSLHSLEHSPDPMVLLKLFDDFCENWVIEVPDGERTKEGATVNNKFKGDFPVWSNQNQKHLKKVGGHYQLFHINTLEWIARNLLRKDKVYYIGKSVFQLNSLAISTHRELCVPVITIGSSAANMTWALSKEPMNVLDLFWRRSL